MRRLGRWTINALTVVSVVFFVASAAMWVRSRTYTDGVDLQDKLRDSWRLDAFLYTVPRGVCIEVLRTRIPPADRDWFLKRWHPEWQTWHVRTRSEKLDQYSLDYLSKTSGSFRFRASHGEIF